MPCNSDYLEPTTRERELWRAAVLYRYALIKLSRPIPAALDAAASSLYCQADYTASLCALIQSLDEQGANRLVYNAREGRSRDLADWWEAHQKADKKRIGPERELATRHALREKALAKLTPAERRALDL
jgi:hypothetical protein